VRYLDEVIIRFERIIIESKNEIFCWVCFPRVVQEQTLSEVGN